MVGLPNSSSPKQDSVSNQEITSKWVESIPEEVKDAVLYKFCKAVEANLPLEEHFKVIEAIRHDFLSGKYTELVDSVNRETELDRKKKDVLAKKKMKPRGFSPKK